MWHDMTCCRLSELVGRHCCWTSHVSNGNKWWWQLSAPCCLSRWVAL